MKNQHVPKSCTLQLSGCSRKSKVDDTGVLLMLHCHQVTKVSITGNQDALFLARDRKDGMVGQGVRQIVHWERDSGICLRARGLSFHNPLSHRLNLGTRRKEPDA